MRKSLTRSVSEGERSTNSTTSGWHALSHRRAWSILTPFAQPQGVPPHRSRLSGRPRVRFGLILLALAGCSQSSEETPMQPVTAAKRAERRLFPGAPPVIPHPPLSGKCVTCHTSTGSARPPLGLAPANPHTKTPGMSDESGCKQCHVFQATQDVFVASTFEPFTSTGPHGRRAHSLAPPTVPHHHFMREDCAACHTGPASRPEIRCSHADRARCVQCHVHQTPGDWQLESHSSVGEPKSPAGLTRLNLDSSLANESSTR